MYISRVNSLSGYETINSRKRLVSRGNEFVLSYRTRRAPKYPWGARARAPMSPPTIVYAHVSRILIRFIQLIFYAILSIIDNIPVCCTA